VSSGLLGRGVLASNAASTNCIRASQQKPAAVKNRWWELIYALYRSAYGGIAVFGADLACVDCPAGAQAID